MRTEELDYHLPGGLIAQRPLPHRQDSRLLTLDRTTGRVEHRGFRELPDLLAPGSLLVLNDSRVFPARIECRKPTGGRIEVLLVRRLGPEGITEPWSALLGTRGRIREGSVLAAPELTFEVIRRIDGPLFELSVTSARGCVRDAVDRAGTVPLPPYIRREPDEGDRERYQTVYARHVGSAAAPTAGLHFTDGVLDRIARGGHEILTITLHVGPGTFRPVHSPSLEGHRMHEEWVTVDGPTAGRIREARDQGRPVVAVGTTVVRTLEGVHARTGRLAAYSGPVDLFIRPGYRFQIVDELVTNFHLPRSTLLALVMALGGVEHVRAGYAEAVERGYRFYSYGDAMFVLDGAARTCENGRNPTKSLDDLGQ